MSSFDFHAFKKYPTVLPAPHILWLCNSAGTDVSMCGSFTGTLLSRSVICTQVRHVRSNPFPTVAHRARYKRLDSSMVDRVSPPNHTNKQEQLYPNKDKGAESHCSLSEAAPGTGGQVTPLVWRLATNVSDWSIFVTLIITISLIQCALH